MEELIRLAATNVGIHGIKPNDLSMLTSMAYQIETGRQLTTRQAYAITKLLRNYTDDSQTLARISPQQWSEYLNQNNWKMRLRESIDRKREARYLGGNLVGISMNYNATIEPEFVKLSGIFREGLRIVEVTPEILPRLISLLADHSFSVDTILEQYLEGCLNDNNRVSMAEYISDTGEGVVHVTNDPVLSLFCAQIMNGEEL